ncbi:uncharacterized protein LOC115891585 [Sitophilus oryzae]|uniref:Uncharacterized protein LOC115891585 n=1 Tax=Sitophilus oryzae TaxID=7048 RepID=A0A6J2YXH8_SITOR|nr:uncharacterized protein LOC115891585 [Sitophilus oryzae]
MSKASKNKKLSNKSEKRGFCRCCSDEEKFNDTTEAFINHFGKEFTEYEYVIENLAIRPIPKKLLDLVPVHNAPTRSEDDIYDLKCIQKSSTQIKDCLTASVSNAEADLSADGDSPRLKILSDDDQRVCTRHDMTTGSLDKLGVLPGHKKGGHFRNNRNYKSPQQVITDLCMASEKSLNFKPIAAPVIRSIPTEIQDTIESLKFKKPQLGFQPKIEKDTFQTQQMYFAEVTNEKQNLNRVYGHDSHMTSNVSTSGDYDKEENLSSTIDSVVQTEPTTENSFIKRKKRNLKWKIIINKHSNVKLKGNK